MFSIHCGGFERLLISSTGPPASSSSTVASVPSSRRRATTQPAEPAPTCPPEELDLRYEGVKRNVPPPAGSISLTPAGSPGWVRSSGCKEELHIFLEPGLVGRVAAEAFGFDPAQLTLPPLDGLHLLQLRTAMLAVNDELMADAAGGPLVAESLANVLAVRLIRNA